MDLKEAQRIGLGMRTPYTDDCHFTGQHIKDGYDWLIAEHDRLTAELTSAKEEIERQKESVTHWYRYKTGYYEAVERAEAAETLSLSAERKETERLREVLQRIAGYDFSAFAGIEGPVGLAKAALQSRQGEADKQEVCEWDGNVAGCGGRQHYQFCPYCRKPLVIKEEAQ